MATQVPNQIQLQASKCSVCSRKAHCLNYGALTCDACKMFFKRCILDTVTFGCYRGDNQCFKDIHLKTDLPPCRYCRYQKCLGAGMRYLPSMVPKLPALLNDDVASQIGHFVWLDTRRHDRVSNFITDKNPSLRDMITMREFRMKRKSDGYPMSIDDWTFMSLFTTVEFFMAIDFMHGLAETDKIVIMRNFYMKSSIFSCAMRTVNLKSDQMITPDGETVYPNALLGLSKFSPAFLFQIRSRLVARLIELNISREEYVLLTLIFFCNATLDSLSPAARSTIAAQQSTFSSILFQYCLLTAQKNGPARFTDLLSLCHVLNSNFKDFQSLTLLFHAYMPPRNSKLLLGDAFED